MAVMNLNGMIDGILMGRLLGPDALSSIQASMPVISGIAALNLLFTNGAAVIVSKALGGWDYKESNRSITVSLISNLAAGILLAAFSLPLSSVISDILCKDPGLTENVRKYVLVLLIGSLLLMLQNGMSVIADVAIGPRVVTVSIISSVVVNLICDMIFVKFIGMDIKGAALATLMGAASSITIFLLFFIKNKKKLELKFDLSSAGKMLGENITRGIPGMISTLAIMLLTLMCNFFIQNALGKEGMFVISIGFNFVSLANMIAGGIGMAFLAIGGMLCGQKDYTGLKLLYLRGMMISMFAVILFNVIAWLIPDKLAELFGANSDDLIQLTSSGLPIICTFVVALNIISPTSVIYQLLEHNGLSMVASISMIGSALLALITVSALMPPENIWYAFPAAAAFSVMLVFVLSEIVRHSCKRKVDHISLIPDTQGELNRFDISVQCTEQNIREGIKEIRSFVESQCDDPKLANNIVVCLEELLINIVKFAKKGKGEYFDLVIINENGILKAVIRDNGVPFDPAHCAESEWNFGLKILHHFADEFDYSYSFGQNITFLTLKSSAEITAENENIPDRE